MKLWDKGYSTDNLVEQYTVGTDRELDMKLAKHDVVGSSAHAKMLHHIGILSNEELVDILKALEAIGSDIDAGTFSIEAGFEDVHSKIEFELVSKIGEAGKKIHTARSRNDQVLVDLHLYAKEEIETLRALVKQLFETLLNLSERHKGVLLPGYTHLQIAMPSSFGLWFGAYAETLIDDLILLQAAHRIADQNPLGSAAGYGSSFPINRGMTTELMGFATTRYNVVAAQMSRGRLEKSVSYALASVAGTLAKLASDVCLYMCQNFGFLSLPKTLTTGSSIMPHKQNPDVFELMRAQCNKIQNLPFELQAITNNLTSGYHRDFQLLKSGFMEAVDSLKSNLGVCDFMMQHIVVNDGLLDNAMYEHLFSVEEVNRLVMEGMTFRDAYKELSKQLLEDTFHPSTLLNHTHEGSIGNLCLEEIRIKFNDVYKTF